MMTCLIISDMRLCTVASFQYSSFSVDDATSTSLINFLSRYGDIKLGLYHYT